MATFNLDDYPQNIELRKLIDVVFFHLEMRDILADRCLANEIARHMLNADPNVDGKVRAWYFEYELLVKALSSFIDYVSVCEHIENFGLTGERQQIRFMTITNTRRYCHDFFKTQKQLE